MIWLDLFLQCFVQGLAWCAAVLATAAAVLAVARIGWAIYVRVPLRRDRS